MKFLIKQNRYAQLARAAPELAEELQAKLSAHLKERHDAMRAQAATEPAAQAAGGAGQQLLILYGSDTGVTEQLAKKFSGMCLERGLRVAKICDLDEMSEVEDRAAESLGDAGQLCRASSRGRPGAGGKTSPKSLPKMQPDSASHIRIRHTTSNSAGGTSSRANPGAL